MTRFDDGFEARATPRMHYFDGETGTYYKASGGGAVSGICTVDESAAMPDEATGIVHAMHILVTVQRRESDDNEDALIIDDPQLGDGFVREGDPSDKVYAYTGEKLDVTSDSWRLRFARDIPIRTGGNFGHAK